MPFYRNAEIFCDVLGDLFGRVLGGETGEPAKLKNLSLRLNTSDPVAHLLVDGHARPPSFECQAVDGPADLKMYMQADLLHEVWLGKVRLRDAFLSGQIQLEGSIIRALGLSEVFRELEALYPTVLAEHGLLKMRSDAEQSGTPLGHPKAS